MRSPRHNRIECHEVEFSQTELVAARTIRSIGSYRHAPVQCIARHSGVIVIARYRIHGHGKRGERVGHQRVLRSTPVFGEVTGQ